MMSRRAPSQAPSKRKQDNLGYILAGWLLSTIFASAKGFLAKGDRSAEEVAKSILEKMRQFDKGPDESAFVQEGWDAIKQEIGKHEAEYTQEKCSWVANEWAKMVATMTPK